MHGFAPHLVAAALIGLAATTGCFRPDISKLPRDRGPLPAPSWDWNPIGGEVDEFPIPAGSTWLPSEQAKLARSSARELPAGFTERLAVYASSRPWAEVVAFYSQRWEGVGNRVESRSETLFPESGLLPEVRLTPGPPVRIVLRKILPPGTRPPGSFRPAEIEEEIPRQKR